MSEDRSRYQVGNIENYYGGLHIKSEGGKFFWSIQDVGGHAWEEIPESLYRELEKLDFKEPTM